MQIRAWGVMDQAGFSLWYLIINYTSFDFISQFQRLKRCIKNPKVFWDFADKPYVGILAPKGHRHEKIQ